MSQTTHATFRIGATIRDRRKALGLTQAQVVDQTNIPDATAYGRVERETDCSRMMARLDDVAGALDWTLEELIAAARATT
jgi:transcriptional regulator with XRE-family HTH domain